MSSTTEYDLGRLPEGLPVIVTGATGAIGTAITRRLADEGVKVILAVRSEEKFRTLADMLKKRNPEANVEFLHLDLNDSRSVMEAVNALHGRQLAGVINNAGVMMRDFTLSPDGPETTLNVNFFNTRLFNLLLLPQVAQGGGMVFTTSQTRLAGRRHNLPTSVSAETFGQLKTYALSKKLITRFAAEFAPVAAREGVNVNCADPGVVDSDMISMHRWYDPLANIFFRPFIRRPAKGAIPALRALASDRRGLIFTLRRSFPINDFGE